MLDWNCCYLGLGDVIEEDRRALLMPTDLPHSSSVLEETSQDLIPSERKPLFSAART